MQTYYDVVSPDEIVAHGESSQKVPKVPQNLF